MKINKLAILFFAFNILFISCNQDDDDDNIFDPKGDYENGTLISGEGSATTGSVTFIPEDLSAPQQLIFKTVNDAELGTFLQSIAFSESNAYICVDNANTINVVDRYTFKEIAKITDQLVTPRYMVAVGDTGYATNWGSTAVDTDDFIAVIDLNTNKVTKTIPVGLGPERIVAKDGKLYVSHKGAYGTNNKVAVIDVATEVITEITVADEPDELFFDADDNLWVLSSGRASWTGSESNGSIAKINTTTNTITTSFDLATTEHPNFLTYSGGKIYYLLCGNVYEMEVSAATLPTSSILEIGSVYGMEVNNGQLYGLNASFSALSELNIYSISSKEKTKTMSVSLGASKIYFNK